ncbi:hypothetical protein [Tahibacter amnicola]|uniref:Class I SAM-dependent methyltransferase n=1 Tax=Tahibacter amnicola TaxID=2976241 RepID=A0ABY6BJW1_9GAMM|nr:hypothetical protein [Tahibacter amnicola]UXI70308.1 hypothetical protein N4264_11925 [Tahibacter amnicola]
MPLANSLTKAFNQTLFTIACEPPIRLLARWILRRVKAPLPVKSFWDAADYPQYLFGVLKAAQFARAQGLTRIAVAEMGCAGGRGLLAMARHAQDLARHFGIDIRVYGFDAGTGLPTFCGDYRDHPDAWKAGDFPMDVDRLRQALPANTQLVIGNVEDTVAPFLRDELDCPLGFVAFDLDLYSSTRAALRIVEQLGERDLLRVPLYFDDLGYDWSHRRAGEPLAIEEFNRENDAIIIEQWLHASAARPFHEAPWLKRFFLAHNLAKISKSQLVGEANRVHDLAY